MSARSLNSVMLIGNLTRDPEIRYTANGTAVVTFGIATNKSWKVCPNKGSIGKYKIQTNNIFFITQITFFFCQ